MWSVDTEFNIDLPSGNGRRAGNKRKRDDGELVAVDEDDVVVVDANGVAHNEARDEQANARVKKKKKTKQTPRARNNRSPSD